MPVAPLRLVLATRNRDKVLEIRAALSDCAVEVLSLEAFRLAPEVVEDGATLEANARKKALEIHRHTGLPALADDTGLFVEALHGAPGVYSSRYAGGKASYEENVAKLLAALREVPAGKRAAEFTTVMAFAQNGDAQVVRGSCAGSIAFAPRGASRFGYDPVFVLAGGNRTYAEMTLAEKNVTSHRGRALAALKEMLQQSGLI